MQVTLIALTCVSMLLLVSAAPESASVVELEVAAPLAAPVDAPDSENIISCDKMAELTDFNGDTVVRMTMDLRRCLDLELSDEVRTALVALKAKAPLSISNVAFLNEVCIFSKHNEGQYLYNPIRGYRFEEGIGRHPFVFIPGGRPAGRRGDWRFFPVGTHFMIAATNNGEFLAASQDVGAQRRRVYTVAVPVEALATPERYLLWDLEVVDDDLLIKNVEFPEYFYPLKGKDLYYDEERRNVATWMGEDVDCHTEQCMWTVTAC